MLSNGPAAGLMVVELFGVIAGGFGYVSTGGVLGVTETFKFAVLVFVPSEACSVKLAFVAVQLAPMSAVMMPLVLTRFETVTPFDGLADATVTVTFPLPPSSATVAI